VKVWQNHFNQLGISMGQNNMQFMDGQNGTILQINSYGTNYLDLL
jgi:hypothetical protein